MLTRRTLLATGSCALASGCAAGGNNLADQALVFDSHSLDAIVVVGVNANRPIDLRFKRYDPSSYALINPGSSETTFVTRYSNFNKDRFKVHKVWPGSYALHEAETTTQEGYIGVRSHTWFGPRENGGSVGPNTLVFSVSRGEIIYIGNFLVGNTDVRSASTLTVSLETADARDALKAYPNIKGTMQTRALQASGPASQRRT